jgi:hypothetical protein
MHPSDEYVFKWHKLSAVLTVDGKNITNDGNWEVIPAINVARKAMVTLPNGGESWTAGRLYTIEWTRPTSASLVYLDYSIDDGATWIRINSSPIDINNMDFRWETPRISSTECLIRLVDANTGKTIDQSDNPFAIVPIGANIIRPALSDGVFRGGKADFIKWNMDDAVNVVFEFSADGTDNWQKVTAKVNSQLGQVQWTLPAVNSKDARVRMVDPTSGQVLAISQRFLVLAGAVNITSPAAGSSVEVGQKANIAWNAQDVTKFDLSFSADGGAHWTDLARDVDALKGAQQWIVPNVSTDHAIIRALYNDDPEMEYSRVEFAINPVSVNDQSQSGFAFEQPQPNPFFGTTNLQFTLPFQENVTITVMNSIGQTVATPVDHVNYGAGTFTVPFSDYNLAAGVYYVHIFAGTFTEARKVVKLK